MSSASISTRLLRLDSIAARLAEGSPCSIADLADQLGVTTRTVARDLRLLRERGALIDGEPGRGGGVRLARDSPTFAPLSLRESEALELLLAMAASEAMGLSLTGALAGIRSQLARSFAPADRVRISELRRRIRVAVPLSAQIQQTRRPEQPRVRQAVQSAFVRQLRLELAYIAGDGRRSLRRVEPQALLLAWPVWYVLTWDVDRAAVRSFRMDRVELARSLDERFRPKPVQLFWDHCENVGIAL